MRVAVAACMLLGVFQAALGDDQQKPSTVNARWAIREWPNAKTHAAATVARNKQANGELPPRAPKDEHAEVVVRVNAKQKDTKSSGTASPAALKQTPPQIAVAKQVLAASTSMSSAAPTKPRAQITAAKPVSMAKTTPDITAAKPVPVAPTSKASSATTKPRAEITAVKPVPAAALSKASSPPTEPKAPITAAKPVAAAVASKAPTAPAKMEAQITAVKPVPAAATSKASSAPTRPNVQITAAKPVAAAAISKSSPPPTKPKVQITAAKPVPVVDAGKASSTTPAAPKWSRPNITAARPAPVVAANTAVQHASNVSFNRNTSAHHFLRAADECACKFTGSCNCQMAMEFMDCISKACSSGKCVCPKQQYKLSCLNVVSACDNLELQCANEKCSCSEETIHIEMEEKWEAGLEKEEKAPEKEPTEKLLDELKELKERKCELEKVNSYGWLNARHRLEELKPRIEARMKSLAELNHPLPEMTCAKSFEEWHYSNVTVARMESSAHVAVPAASGVVLAWALLRL